jgi:hypothetical protein
MTKDLTTSNIDRQNILNNPFALQEIEKAIGIKGIYFEGKIFILREQAAAFFEVTVRTINNYIEIYGEELRHNGYDIIRGKRLTEFKLAIGESFGKETDFLTKTTVLGIFDFRAFLNLAMLMSEGERARIVRQAMLDIVIDTVNLRAGGSTKYINQRDEDFLQSAFTEENYRKTFTNALSEYVDMGVVKYPIYTNKIYLSIFRENAAEYRKILKLEQKVKVRSTMYSEVLDIIASYESGFAEILERESKSKNRKLSVTEVDELFKEFELQALWRPLVEKARVKMASRDYNFRQVLHEQLEGYLQPLQRDEFERFLGEKSKELDERLEDAKDVMKRLKDR